MGTFSQIDTTVQNRTGIKGDNYSVQRKAAINWAVREICTVRFWFLYKPGTEFSTSVNGNIYPLPSNFLHQWKFWLTDASGTKRELVEGTVEDIVHLPPSDTGTPKYFQVSGSTVSGSTTVPAVYIGNPTASAAFTVDYGYFHLPVDLVADGDISIISSLYRDDPIINGAVYKLYDDTDDEKKAQDAYQKFVASMRMMENTMVFEGAEYADLLQFGAKAESE